MFRGGVLGTRSASIMDSVFMVEVRAKAILTPLWASCSAWGAGMLGLALASFVAALCAAYTLAADHLIWLSEYVITERGKVGWPETAANRYS